MLLEPVGHEFEILTEKIAIKHVVLAGHIASGEIGVLVRRVFAGIVRLFKAKAGIGIDGIEEFGPVAVGGHGVVAGLVEEIRQASGPGAGEDIELHAGDFP